MNIRWDNQLYEAANAKVISSTHFFASKRRVEWLKDHFSARLLFLCDMVVNCALLPFAIIGVCFGTLHFALMWNRTIFTPTKNFILEKTNHLLISGFGAVIYPALAHKFKDSQVPAYFLLAIRIVFIAGGLYWAFFTD